MTSVILNRKIIEKSLKRRTNLELIKDKITMLGTPLEDLNKNELVIEVFPNRPDLLSEQGFSRALNSFLDYSNGLREYKIKKSNYKVIVDNSVNKVRPYTAFFLVKNIKLDNNKIVEIMNIQEKLHLTFCRNRKKASIGIYPGEKISMPVHYKLMPKEKISFQPLEMQRVMNVDEILKRHETAKKYSYLLDKLNSYPVFIDSKNKIISLVPIINSHETGKITLNTKEFFVECTGTNLTTVNLLSNILATTFIDMYGDVYSMEIKYGNKILVTPEMKTRSMKINLDNVNKLLGTKLNENEIKKCLEKMGYGYKNKNVTIPCYRADIINEVDLIEDIAIAYGYENFNPELPSIATIGHEDDFNAFKEKIANFLTGLNLLECNTYVVSNPDYLNKKMLLNNDLVLLSNSLNQDYNALRNFITPSLLKVVKENKHNEYPQRLFEIGKVFVKDKTNVMEYDRLSIVLTHINANFTEIKQILDSLMSNLNLEYEIDEAEHNSFIKGRTGRIKIKDKKIAFIGEINPAVIKNYDLDMPVAALELNLTELFEFLK